MKSLIVAVSAVLSTKDIITSAEAIFEEVPKGEEEVKFLLQENRELADQKIDFAISLSDVEGASDSADS